MTAADTRLDKATDPEEAKKVIDRRIESLVSERLQQRVEATLGTDGATERLEEVTKKITDLEALKKEFGAE